MITAVLIFQIELDIANLVDFVYDVNYQLRLIQLLKETVIICRIKPKFLKRQNASRFNGETKMFGKNPLLCKRPCPGLLANFGDARRASVRRRVAASIRN